MSQPSLYNEIMQMPVIDTHTHLVGNKLCANDFWEISDYFWLNRELQSAGYPADADRLPQEERAAAFVSAYHGSRNTMMNRAFTAIMKNLYEIALTDAESVLKANETVKQKRNTADWAQHVADRLNVVRFVVNHPDHAAFAGMREDALLLPRIDSWLPELARKIADSSGASRQSAFEYTKRTISDQLQSYQAMGSPGIMTTLSAYEASAHEAYELSDNSSIDEITMMLLHEICSELQERGMFLQLFLGIERGWGTDSAAPVNNSLRIVKLYGLFESYSIAFELVVASELNNMDIVQAAWNFPNVHVGGMWWYNFRPSTYLQSMQYRLEAIAPLKSSLVVSDARCIEWTYGKLLLVKELLAHFLDKQVENGWISREDALYSASEWLHGSAAKRYGLTNSTR
ncbi:glucuronate isomerase [Paenibacillus sp. FSL H8-0548]|uniref:glucuronate isomerase n=1 Tax=Paenibacillus sp. FSL H8-0548 TaxID=1920422 RepID=UPI00096E5C6D|nr:glucuronate isomerase [Paenibacillus sp. FSL H8-0548]OMF38015.1 glucuronate isomerase [Paenibacillus sp. FSL H8-0548]